MPWHMMTTSSSCLLRSGGWLASSWSRSHPLVPGAAAVTAAVGVVTAVPVPVVMAAPVPVPVMRPPARRQPAARGLGQHLWLCLSRSRQLTAPSGPKGSRRGLVQRPGMQTVSMRTRPAGARPGQASHPGQGPASWVTRTRIRRRTKTKKTARRTRKRRRRRRKKRRRRRRKTRRRRRRMPRTDASCWQHLGPSCSGCSPVQLKPQRQQLPARLLYQPQQQHPPCLLQPWWPWGRQAVLRSPPPAASPRRSASAAWTASCSCSANVSASGSVASSSNCSGSASASSRALARPAATRRSARVSARRRGQVQGPRARRASRRRRGRPRQQSCAVTSSWRQVAAGSWRVTRGWSWWALMASLRLLPRRPRRIASRVRRAHVTGAWLQLLASCQWQQPPWRWASHPKPRQRW
mmetsp:Transcript_9592/g.23762  ORF Transcript_9592/g.23762 Transcript_9592/m.23762 type:complete len:408 (+) Transcript_9592:1305-2528(+)